MAGWQSPSLGCRAPPPPKPIKAQSPPPAVTGHLHLLQDREQVRRAAGGLQLHGRRGGLRDPVSRGWGGFAGQRMDIFPESDKDGEVWRPGKRRPTRLTTWEVSPGDAP